MEGIQTNKSYPNITLTTIYSNICIKERANYSLPKKRKSKLLPIQNNFTEILEVKRFAIAANESIWKYICKNWTEEIDDLGIKFSSSHRNEVHEKKKNRSFVAIEIEQEKDKCPHRLTRSWL